MQDARERLVRYLNDAWAVEKSLPVVFGDFRKETKDTDLNNLFLQLEQDANRHEAALEAHLRAKGEEPQGGKSLLNQIFAKTLDILHGAHDDYEKSVTDLMKAYTIVRFQSAIYEAIRAYAESLGETETARLAIQHRDAAEAGAKAVWPMLTNFSGRVPMPA